MNVPSLSCYPLQNLKPFPPLGGRRKCAAFSRSFLGSTGLSSAAPTVQLLPCPRSGHASLPAPLMTYLQLPVHTGAGLSGIHLGDGGLGRRQGRVAPRDQRLRPPGWDTDVSTTSSIRAADRKTQWDRRLQKLPPCSLHSWVKIKIRA